jgi:hypothetical protein
LLRSQRRQLHARAAWDLETRSTDRLGEVAAVLGGHFAAAGQPTGAAHHMELAADLAARIFANDEAVDLYRQTLGVIDQSAIAVGPARGVAGYLPTTTAPAVCEKLAMLLTLVDRFDEARAASLDGLTRTPVHDTVGAARLY